jgi:hypothetical protein
VCRIHVNGRRESGGVLGGDPVGTAAQPTRANTTFQSFHFVLRIGQKRSDVTAQALMNTDVHVKSSVEDAAGPPRRRRQPPLALVSPSPADLTIPHLLETSAGLSSFPFLNRAGTFCGHRGATPAGRALGTRFESEVCASHPRACAAAHHLSRNKTHDCQIAVGLCKPQ